MWRFLLMVQRFIGLPSSIRNDVGICFSAAFFLSFVAHLWFRGGPAGKNQLVSSAQSE